MNQKMQKMPGDIAMHFRKNGWEISVLPRRSDNENSQMRYLKFWGNDYPYLKEDNQPRYLPIPEDSDTQRFLRKLNRAF